MVILCDDVFISIAFTFTCIATFTVYCYTAHIWLIYRCNDGLNLKITTCNHKHIICNKKHQHGIEALVLIIALPDRKKDPDSVTG